MIDRLWKAIATWPYARMLVAFLGIGVWFLWSMNNDKDKQLRQCNVEKDSMRVYYTDLISNERQKTAEEKQAQLEKEKAELKAKVEELDNIINQTREKLKRK